MKNGREPHESLSGGMTAFISYSHADRSVGAQAKTVLEEAGIGAFLAHEDLQVSELWRQRIVEELQRCSMFVPLLSASFLTSPWALQEVGFIASREDVLVTPLSIDGTIPCGFIAHLQSGRIGGAGITSELLLVPVARKQPRLILPALIRTAGAARSFRDAEDKMRPLVPLFSELTPEEAQALAEASVRNGQIWSAAECRNVFLPEFIRVQRASIAPDTLRALEYQVANDSWYSEATRTLAR